MNYDFKYLPVATLKVKIGLNSSGLIAQAGETVASQKVITISGFKQGGNLAEATELFDAILGGLANCTYDSLSTQKISYEIVTDSWIDVQFTREDVIKILSGEYVPVDSSLADDVHSIFSGDYQPSGNVFSRSDVAALFN